MLLMDIIAYNRPFCKMLFTQACRTRKEGTYPPFSIERKPADIGSPLHINIQVP